MSAFEGTGPAFGESVLPSAPKPPVVPDEAVPEAYEQGRDDESTLWNTALSEARVGAATSWQFEPEGLRGAEWMAHRIEQIVGRNRRASERQGRTLTAAAPAIVAADPKLVRGVCLCNRVKEGAVSHTEECVAAYWSANPPETKPADDLRALLSSRLWDLYIRHEADGNPDRAEALADLLAPAVQAWVDAQVERLRAQHAAAHEPSPPSRSVGFTRHAYDSARADFRRALGVEDGGT